MEYSYTKTILAIVIIIAVGLVLYFLLLGSPGDLSETIEVSDGVVVEQVDLENTTGANRLPPGFPLDIPVNVDTIQESYSVDYNESGFTQHSLSYTTDDSIEGVYTTYKEYMENDGYDMSDTTLVADSIGSLYGAKDGNDLSVVVSVHSDGTLVNLSYLER